MHGAGRHVLGPAPGTPPPITRLVLQQPDSGTVVMRSLQMRKRKLKKIKPLAQVTQLEVMLKLQMQLLVPKPSISLELK